MLSYGLLMWGTIFSEVQQSTVAHASGNNLIVHHCILFLIMYEVSANYYLKCSNRQTFCVTADLHNPETFTRPWFSKAKLQMNIDFINVACLKHFMNVLKEMYFLVSLWTVSHLSVSHNKEVVLVFIPFSLIFLWIMNFTNSSYTVISYNYFIRNWY